MPEDIVMYPGVLSYNCVVRIYPRAQDGPALALDRLLSAAVPEGISAKCFRTVRIRATSHSAPPLKHLSTEFPIPLCCAGGCAEEGGRARCAVPVVSEQRNARDEHPGCACVVLLYVG